MQRTSLLCPLLLFSSSCTSLLGLCWGGEGYGGVGKVQVISEDAAHRDVSGPTGFPSSAVHINLEVLLGLPL